jgi:hypothetical protein
VKWFRFLFLNPLTGLLVLSAVVYLAVYRKDWATAALIVAAILSFGFGWNMDEPWKKPSARP